MNSELISHLFKTNFSSMLSSLIYLLEKEKNYEVYCRLIVIEKRLNDSMHLVRMLNRLESDQQ